MINIKKLFCLSVLLIIFSFCGCSNSSSIKSEPVSSYLTNEQAIATAKSLNEKYNLSMDKVFNLKYSAAEVETDGYNRYIVRLVYEYENKNRQLNKNDLLFYYRYDPDTENILSSRNCFWATDNFGIGDQDGWEYLKSKDEFGWGTDPNASTESIDPESTPDTSEQLESTSPDQDSNDAQNDQSADAPNNESISSSENWTYRGSSGVISPRFYNEFGTEIGNYYSIDIPTFWDGKYDMEVIPNGYGYNTSFYCSSERETGCGGLLFSVLMLDLEDDCTIYPSYVFMGEMGVYRIGTYNMVIYYPSDVQWQNPESGYSAMANSIDDIVASIKFGDEVTFTKANSN